MQVAPSLLLALLACAAPAPARAAQATAQQALPTARELVERHAAACNLREALVRSRSMHVRGRVSIPASGVEGTLEMWNARPGLSRSRIELGSGVTVTGGFDGTVAWMIHSVSGPSVFEGLDLLQSRLESDWDEELKEGDAYESLRTVGRERFEGKECWKVEVVARPLPGMDVEATLAARTAHEYYEIETGLLAGEKSRQGDVLTVTVQSDYKDFGGRKLATRRIVRQAGQETLVTIDSVELDTVSEGFFRLPPEIQRLLEPSPAR